MVAVSCVEFETALHDLCTVLNNKYSCRAIITDHKWVINGSALNYVDVQRKDVMVNLTIGGEYSTPIYKKVQEYFASEDSIKAIIPIAGYHTQPARLLEYALRRAFDFDSNTFEQSRLLSEYKKLLAFATTELHEFSITGRLHGVRLDVDHISLADGVDLVKLIESEINERQPFMSDANDGPTLTDYSKSNVEIQIKGSYKITPHGENSYFNVVQQAHAELGVKLNLTLRALKLHKHGIYEVYPYKFKGPLYPGGSSRSIEPRYMHPVVVKYFRTQR